MNKIIRDYEIAIKLLEAQNKHLSNKIQQLEAAHRTEYCEEADYDCKALGEARKQIATLEANQHKWNAPKDKLPDVPMFWAVTKYNAEPKMYRKNLVDPDYTTEWLNIRNDILWWMPIPEVPKED